MYGIMYGISERDYEVLEWLIKKVEELPVAQMLNALTDRHERWKVIRYHNQNIIHVYSFLFRHSAGNISGKLQVIFQDKWFSDETFRGGFYHSSLLSNCTFKNCKMENVMYCESAMKNCVFENCTFLCSGLDSMVDLENVTFNNCKFIDSEFCLYKYGCETNENAYEDYCHDSDENIITPEKVSVTEKRIVNLKFKNCISSYIITRNPEV